MSELLTPPTRRPSRGQNRPPARRPRRLIPAKIPAGHAIQVMVTALFLTMIFNSHAMVHAGEGMRPGTTRELVLDVARPVDSFAHALWLDKPRAALGKLFGNEPAPTGPSALTRIPNSSPATTARPPATVAKLRMPTAAAPLRLLVTGDSMTEFLGPALINQAAVKGKVTGTTITKYGTGLVRPDFFDWSIYAQQLVAQQKPEAVVVMMGGNDGQGITLANHTVLVDGTAAWGQEYERRVEVVMRIFAGNGTRRVYWVPMPVPRNARLATDYHLMDRAVMQAAAAVPGVTDVDIVHRLSNNGRYADYLPGLNGQTILARTPDGIHLSQDGAALAASLILTAMNKDWHLTT